MGFLRELSEEESGIEVFIELITGSHVMGNVKFVYSDSLTLKHKINEQTHTMIIPQTSILTLSYISIKDKYEKRKKRVI